MKCKLNQGRLPEHSGALHLKIFNTFNELISNRLKLVRTIVHLLKGICNNFCLLISTFCAVKILGRYF